MKITKQARVKLLSIAVLAAMSAAAVPEREQRNYLDTTWWDPYVENITDVDTNRSMRTAATALVAA